MLSVGRVVAKLDGLKRVVGSLQASELPHGLPLLLAKRYETFIKRRYLSASAGDGTWEPLAASTLARRGGKGTRKARKAGKIGAKKPGPGTTGRGAAKILRDTGTLFKALTIGAPGNLTRSIPGGVRFGVIGPGRHSKFKGDIKTLALIHDQGKGHMPRRQIIVEPDAATVKALEGAVERTVKRLIAEQGK
jgi:hypothetical protein